MSEVSLNKYLHVANVPMFFNCVLNLSDNRSDKPKRVAHCFISMNCCVVRY
jgi:hypothetical protein